MSSSLIIIVLVTVFIVYRIYLRMRRTFSWQPIHRRKLLIGTALLAVVGLLFFAIGAQHAASLASDTVGLALGVLLAGYGASRTRFKYRDGRWQYRTNVWIGSSVTMLFVVRLAYRVYGIIEHSGTGQQASMGDQLQSLSGSWTSGLMLIMFAYYITTNLILLRRQKSLRMG